MVTTSEFQLAYNAIAEQSIKWAEPALKSETHKHQWTLVGSSVALFAVVLLNVGKIKVGDATILVDQQVVFWYSIFIFALLLTYIIRASLDLKRASLTREKDSEKLKGLNDLVTAALARQNIEHYFWLELFHQIGERYRVYDDTFGASTALGVLPQIDMRTLKLDIEALRKIDHYSKQITAHEAFILKAIKSLDADVERFKDKLLEFDYRQAKEVHPYNDPQHERWEKAHELFKRYLKPWFDARDNLTFEQLNVAEKVGETREQKMLDAQLNLLTRTKRIQRAYAVTEIALPSVLAGGAAIYALTTIF